VVVLLVEFKEVLVIVWLPSQCGVFSFLVVMGVNVLLSWLHSLIVL